MARINANEKILKGGVSKAEQRQVRDKIKCDQKLINEKNNLIGYPLVITDKELREQALRLMKKVRYAIMYASLAIHYEEEKLDDTGIVIPYETPLYNND